MRTVLKNTKSTQESHMRTVPGRVSQRENDQLTPANPRTSTRLDHLPTRNPAVGCQKKYKEVTKAPRVR